MVASRFQNANGGLNRAGRKHFHVKAPVKSGVNPRRVMYAARFGHMQGPEYDSNKKPTRLLLSLRKWGFPSKAAARAFAAKHKQKHGHK